MGNRESYLGDGLYAKVDPIGIELKAPRPGIDHVVYLEPQIFLELIRFAFESEVYSPVLWRKVDCLLARLKAEQRA